jgi:predicted kinase
MPALTAGEPVVVMMCGIAGAGKTTYAQALVDRGYVRLSIDEEIWRRFGRDAAEFDPDEYEGYKVVARQQLRQELVRLIRAGRSVVLDESFWNRAARDDYKALIAGHGGRWELVYLKADRATLRRRLTVRNALTGANAVTVSDELLDRYLDGFEEPVGEGETVIPQR